MKYYIDTEFIEDGKTIDLISIGIVAEDNETYYAINSDCDLSKANNWVKTNVLTQLPPNPNNFNPENESPRRGEESLSWKSKHQIATEILRFIKKNEYPVTIDEYNFIELKQLPLDKKPEFWGYFADYDWVVFCQLYGAMISLPVGFPMYCNDIKQFCNFKGNPRLPEQGKGEHHALRDAQWNKTAFEMLLNY